MANTTWDSATATAVTLSGGDLVASNTGTTSANQGAHVAFADAKTTGKYYFEVTFTTLTAGGNRGIGVGSTTSTFTGMGGPSALNGGDTVYAGSGNIYSNGAGSGKSLGARAAGNVIAVAIDLDNRFIWFRVAPSGDWNNTAGADPATNTGGIGHPAGAMVPFCMFGGASGTAGNVFTANFGDSAFVGTVPSGYTAGWPKASTNTTWNPSDKSANVILSNGNLTGTANTSAVGFTRAVDRQFTGKYYWEVTYNNTGNPNNRIGVTLGSVDLSLLNSSNCIGSFFLSSTSDIYCNNTFIRSLTAATNGMVICIAINIDTGMMFCRQGATGNWNGLATADPTTGSGGVFLRSGGGYGVMPFIQCGFNTEQMTANFGDSAFVGVVPTGYTAGFPVGVLAVNNAIATQAALEEWITTNPDAQLTQIGLEEWVVIAGGTLPPPTITSKQYAVSVVS